ncbi:MAG: CoxG family protein [Sandaracinobacter sp.]
MHLAGQTVINATRDTVWDALNDPDVLARCIDGVESLQRTGANRFEGALTAKVGPVKARFTGGLELTEVDAPNRYVIVGEGKGGVAGFAKGSAEVVLEDTPEGGTLLRYDARSQVGGKLAQLGTRLVEGAARGYAEAFFAAFKAHVESAADPQPAAPQPAAEAPSAAVASEADVRSAAVAAAAAAATDSRRGLPGWVWVGGLVILAGATVAALL